jgi:hypothetical protein
MMTRKIDIDSADFPPRLAVSATLDTDSGRLAMTLHEGRSLISHNRSQSVQSLIRNGVVNLFRDEQLVWTLTGAFDLSPYKDSGYGNEEAYSYINVKDIPVNAGSIYRLEIDMDGYEKVYSTVVMPADPIVDDASIDIDNPVEKNKVNYVSGYYGSDGPYCPIKCTLKDNTDAQDYYALQVNQLIQSDNPDYLTYAGETGSDVGVSNLTLIQDNPDYEARGSALGDGESYDLYLFNTLLLSDITFRDGNTTLDLFTCLRNERNERNVFPERPADYDPAIYGPEVIFDNRVTLVVKHITAETFKHYRSLLLQEEGLGFFSEPVQINSNVVNGYGCFSLKNTRRVVLKNYKRYYYPQRSLYYGY